MNSLARGLGWLGLALILAPLALVCTLLAVLVAPKAALIVAVVGLAVLGRKLYDRHRKPPPAPAAFDTETAASDWAAPGREVEIICEGKGDYYARRQMLLTVRGWTFSAIWGFGSYSSAGRENFLAGDATNTATTSPDAEIAVWEGEGGMIDLAEGDSVEGWVPPSSLAAAIDAVERGKGAAGIRAAIRRAEPDPA